MPFFGSAASHSGMAQTPSGAPAAARLKEVFGGSGDFSGREVRVGGVDVSLFYIDGLVDSRYVAEEIIKPLTGRYQQEKTIKPDVLLCSLLAGGICGHSCKRISDLSDAVTSLLAGSVILIAGGVADCLSFEAKGFPLRGISEPSNESVSKGAKDSFIENLRTNTALVRRKIRNPALRFTETIVGRQTSTTVSVVWIEGLTNPALVERVNARLNDMDIAALLTAAQLEEYLADNRLTAFPQLLYTERADKFASQIVGGRVGLLVDGLPLSYVVPGTFAEFLQAPEDFSQNYLMASLVTLLRYACLAISLLLPALYLAVVRFHQEVIPTALALSIIQAKQDVPMPSTIEVLAMLAAFEILLEAGMRLPKPIGQTVSIVGALIVGQAAVEAKFVSPAVVIVIAMTGIAGFTSPNQDLSAAVRIWRLVLALFASQLGLFGLGLGCVCLIYHLTGIESFGVAYLSPFGSDVWRDMLSRTVIRPPLWLIKRREGSLGTINRRNQK